MDHIYMNENNQCKKHFSKPFQKHIFLEVDGYPLYQTQDDGHYFRIIDTFSPTDI